MRKLYRLSSILLTSDFCPLISFLLFLTSGFCSAQDLIIHHIDVGQGDCTFIQTRWRTILVDAGNNGMGKSTVIPYLKSLRISHINYLIASHYHADHIGGLGEVLNALDVDTIFDRGTEHPVPKSKTYADYVSSVGIRPRIAVQPGLTYQIAPDIILHFIAAAGKCERGQAMSHDLSALSHMDENSLSIAFTITFVDTLRQSTTNYEPRTMFTYFSGGDLTGYDVGDAVDLETPVAGVVGHAEAMKLNHHGSRSSTNPTFISALSPTCVFISLGRNNSYGHPAPEVIAKLQQHPTIQWIYQTEGKIAVSRKQKIAGTSVLKFYAKGDSSYFTVEWNAEGKGLDRFSSGSSKSATAP
ncbi:MAG: MBL fold metallo-hydrolase [Bacteroidetes bacterium]|nr:MBL fold metallo-hydrolase [Bacteroidota bacterium]